MHRKYKFVLINPYYEKTSKNQKYKMYFNLPSDLKNNEDLKIALNLSYIEKPGQPDTYELKDGDF